MQKTSKLYEELLSGAHWIEYRLTIGDTGTLIDEFGNHITFGGVRILTASSGPDSGFGEDTIISMSTRNGLFSEGLPMIGACVAGEINVSILKPKGDIPKMARLVPYVRLTDGKRQSEWLQKGVYFIDTRSDRGEVMTIHGYDRMLMAEDDFPDSSEEWPRKDIDVVRDIATAMSVNLDERTVSIMNKGYLIPYPADYSQREVLSYIATMYSGSFIMSDLGELRLVQLSGIPKETSLLVNEEGSRITFGGDRIRV